MASDVWLKSYITDSPKKGSKIEGSWVEKCMNDKGGLFGEMAMTYFSNDWITLDTCERRLCEKDG